MAQRRRHYRSPLHAPGVLLIEGAEKLGCELQDLSVGGAGLQAERPLQVGTALTLCFDLEGAGHFELPCLVVRQTQGGGVGLLFEALPAKTEAVLARWVQIQQLEHSRHYSHLS